MPTNLRERLLDEILSCIVDGVPYPNAVAYSKPWYRDAAMVGLVLERVGEIHRIRDWVASLEDPFDRNNGGVEEPDNLGQCLVLASIVGLEDHPIIARVLQALPRVIDSNGVFRGHTDFAPRPVYQAKWLKWGLQRLGLPDPYRIPCVPDSYSALFWMAFKDHHVPCPRLQGVHDYPYLAWAEAHFFGEEPPMHLLGEGETLTWEANASQADYRAFPNRVAGPHSWHAAEAWLYLDDLGW